MNESEYEDARKALLEAARNKDYETANVIRKLIVAFIKPFKRRD